MQAAFLLIGVLLAGQQPPPNLPPANKVTDPARPDFGYMQPWAGAELTVAIVIGADCSRCLDAMPFYKQLASLPAIDGRSRRMVLLADGGIGPVLQAVRSHPAAFKPTKTVSYPADDRFRVRELPAVFVFDAAWNRRGEWQGTMTPEQQAAAVKVIEQVAAEARRRQR